MLVAFAVTLLSAIDAFLVVGAAVAFLRAGGRHALINGIRVGGVAAVAVSGAGALWLSRVDDQTTWQRWLAVAAAASVVALGLYMWTHRGELPGGRRSNPPPRAGEWLALCVITTTVLAREGIHIVLSLAPFVLQVRIAALRAAVVLGIVTAALLAWAWGRYGPRVRMPWFGWTTALLMACCIVVAIVDVASDRATAPDAHLDAEAGP